MRNTNANGAACHHALTVWVGIEAAWPEVAGALIDVTEEGSGQAQRGLFGSTRGTGFAGPLGAPP